MLNLTHNRNKSRQGKALRGGKTLVESAYAATQHLNYHAYRNYNAIII
ncbi:MAG: hypothetical protein LBH20_06685 [Treponema sp.]|jgi:hypothetical protein|nr:hypothetical protein [Treponema sp.]